MAKPIPKPRRIRPTINIQTAFAKPLIRAPAKNRIPPKSIDNFLPIVLVTHEATIEDPRAAKYREDVNMVRVSLLNLQYWFVLESAF